MFVALAASLVLSAGACVEEEEPEPDPACGDGKLNGDEECDGSKFGDLTCAIEGFEAGDLSCTDSCTVDATACVFLDNDQDGLDTQQEQAAGTDPLNPDSDGDGVLDGVEVENGSNPLDMMSYPWAIGAWPNRLAAAAEDGVVAEGWQPGKTAPNWTLIDQYGESVQLHQFYGYTIVLSIGAVWCPPCNQAAEDAEALLSEHRANGVIFLEELVDGAQPGVDATDQDIKNWAEKYGLNFPVLRADTPITASSLPTFYIFNSEMKVVQKIEGYPGEAGIVQAINNAQSQ